MFLLLKFYRLNKMVKHSVFKIKSKNIYINFISSIEFLNG